MPYFHGAYAFIGDSVGADASAVAGLPVYVGPLPVHLTGRPTAPLINKPILLRNLAEAVREVGFVDCANDKWQFPLCEAIAAHFDNAVQNVGPIVVINTLDPATMRVTPPTTAQVALVGGRGIIADLACIPSTVAITDKVIGTDYTAEWNANRQVIEIRDLSGEITSPVTVTYSKVDPDLVTADVMIGQADDDAGIYTGLHAIKTVYQHTGIVPTMLAAPGYSDNPAVRLAMLEAADRVDGHWYVYVLTDIPTETAQTISAARSWRDANGYDSPYEAVHWPMARKGKRVFHNSTLSAVAYMQTDAANDGIPMASASNKPIDVEGYYIDGAPAPAFITTQLNALNREGIRTAAFHGGRWALWGPHTAAYRYDADTPPSETYDSSTRMIFYIANWFSVEYARDVDGPLSQNRADAIINEVRAWLDGLRAAGALVDADVAFTPGQTVGDMIYEGRFDFFSKVTPTPLVRAYVLTIAYDESALSASIGGETV